MNIKQLGIILSICAAARPHILAASWNTTRPAPSKANTCHALQSGTQSDTEGEFVIISPDNSTLPRRRPGQLYLEELTETQDQREQSGVLYMLAQVFPCLFSR